MFVYNYDGETVKRIQPKGTKDGGLFAFTSPKYFPRCQKVTLDKKVFGSVKLERQGMRYGSLTVYTISKTELKDAGTIVDGGLKAFEGKRLLKFGVGTDEVIIDDATTHAAGYRHNQINDASRLMEKYRKFKGECFVYAREKQFEWKGKDRKITTVVTNQPDIETHYKLVTFKRDGAERHFLTEGEKTNEGIVFISTSKEPTIRCTHFLIGMNEDEYGRTYPIYYVKDMSEFID